MKTGFTFHAGDLAVRPVELDHYASIGVTEVVPRLPSAPRDAVLRVLDDFMQYLTNRA